MRIILVISDADKKNSLFVTDTLKAYPLSDAIKAVRDGRIQGIHAVKTGVGTYLRANPTPNPKDNLDFIAFSSPQLYSAIDTATFLSSPGLQQYWNMYSQSLDKLGLNKNAFIVIEGKRMMTKEQVISILYKHRDAIHAAAKHFEIDPYLLGAIMIDEIARMAPFEEMTNAAAALVLSWNASVGVAQVKLETAKGLIKNGYYNPNPEDPLLSEKRVQGVLRKYLYQYVVQPKHSIFFSAAKIRSFIDEWASEVDLRKRPEIITTLYHLPYKKPHSSPGADDRGTQIVEEFYPLAKGILFQK